MTAGRGKNLKVLATRLRRFIRKLQFLEGLLPPASRVTIRYRVQVLVGDVEAELRLLPALAPASSLAVDVGANFGLYTVALSRTGRRVAAFEPVPVCSEALAQWARGRAVTVYGFALGDRDGSAELFLPTVRDRAVTTRASLVRSVGAGRHMSVPIRRLDSMDIGKVGFMKIDAEGGELAVLQGSAATIARDRPNLLLEADPDATPPQQLDATFRLLHAWDYATYVLVGSGLRVCDRVALDGSSNLVCVPVEHRDVVLASVSVLPGFG